MFCEPNILFHGAGAKGKFSGGFDITSFGGLQGGQCMFICRLFFHFTRLYIYSGNTCFNNVSLTIFQWQNQNLVIFQ